MEDNMNVLYLKCKEIHSYVANAALFTHSGVWGIIYTGRELNGELLIHAQTFLAAAVVRPLVFLKMDSLYSQSSDALCTLGDVWDKTLALMQSVSEAASESLRNEPNLVQLQKDRRELDALFDTLKKQVAWIQENKSTLNTIQDTPDDELEQELKEQKELREVCGRVARICADTSLCFSSP